MADDRRIVIEITGGGEGAAKGTGNVGADSEEKETDINDILSTMFHPIKTLEKNTIGRNALVSYAFNNAMNFTKSALRYTLTRRFDLTDNYMAEQDMNNALNVIGTMQGIGVSTYSGARVGAQVGGAWGAAIGAAVGFTASMIKNAFEAEKRERQEQRKFIESDKQNAFQRARMGLTDGGRGTYY